MKIMFVNMRGLGGRRKKLSLKRFINLDQPDVVFIQETMGLCEPIIVELKILLSGWDFMALDSVGMSSGLITSISLTCKITNCFFSLRIMYRYLEYGTRSGIPPIKCLWLVWGL